MRNRIIRTILNYREALKISAIRRKIVLTLLILLFFRLMAHIPVPSVRTEVLKQFFVQNQFLALLDVFSGGTLANFSIAALGLNPYITSSVMIQLLGFVFPQIAELRKEGEYGRRKIGQYTRFLTIPLAIVQSIGMYFLLLNQNLVKQPSLLVVVSFVITMVAGSMILIFLGELINQYGIGNGISLLIFSGIVARYPVNFFQTINAVSGERMFSLLALLLMSIAVVGGIVLVDEAFLKVPIRYARRLVAGRGQSAQSSYLPLKINTAGVMPIIFALALVAMPQMVGRFLSQTSKLSSIGLFLTKAFNPAGSWYNLFYFLLVVVFTYFYTTVVFNPKDVAEDLRKSGGFIPGIRPGIATEKRLSFLLSRVTFIGSIFLGLVAILPFFTQKITGISTISLGGTGILIVVSVVLEINRLIDNMVQTWRYQNYD
jgi:preprotein translocase subunit SecY